MQISDVQLCPLGSFWFMPTNYVIAAWCYILSGKALILKLLEGKNFKQGSWMLWMVMLQDCWARAASLVPCLTCSLTGGGFYQVD